VKPSIQLWKTGGVCADCGGSSGPSGEHACSDPVAPCR
jgi:hypothetical protein